MNPTEAVALCRLAKACCPQQAFDEYTADAWCELLGDLRFQDAKEALLDVARVQPFVAPAEIRARVRKIRADRITAYGPIDVPAGLEEAAYRAYLRDARKRLADGEDVQRLELLPARAMPNFAELMPRPESVEIRTRMGTSTKETP